MEALAASMAFRTPLKLMVEVVGQVWPDNNVMIRPQGFGLPDKIPPSAGTTRLRQRPAAHGQLPQPCSSGLRRYLIQDPSSLGSYHLSECGSQRSIDIKRRDFE